VERKGDCFGPSSLFSFVWKMYAHARKLMENDIWTVDFGCLLGASRLVCVVAGADSTVTDTGCRQGRQDGFLSGPTKPTPKLKAPRIWSTIFSKGPIGNVNYFLFPLKKWEDRQFPGDIPPPPISPTAGPPGGDSHGCRMVGLSSTGWVMLSLLPPCWTEGAPCHVARARDHVLM